MSTSVLTSATLTETTISVPAIAITVEQTITSPFTDTPLVSPVVDTLFRLSGVLNAASGLSGLAMELLFNYVDRNGAAQTFLLSPPMVSDYNTEIDNRFYVKGGTTLSMTSRAHDTDPFLVGAFLHLAVESL